MTLIEVVVAAALAVLMMAAVSGVLKSMRAQKAALANDAVSNHWQRALAERLRWDMVNAREMIAAPRELHLRGFCGRDPASKETTHRLVEVVYAVAENAGQSCLLRRETPLFAESIGRTETELVAVGIGGVVIAGREEKGGDSDLRLLGLGGGETPADPQPNPGNQADRWVPVPREFRLILLGAAQRPILDEIVVF
jgi:type II secretory pathway pseudopilin PulG